MTRIVTLLFLLFIIFGAEAVQAQSFGIFFGDEPGDFSSPFDDDRPAPNELPVCLTDRQIRDAVAAEGFSDISLNVPGERRVRVRATRDGVVYLLNFNFCSGQIEQYQALRPAQ